MLRSRATRAAVVACIALMLGACASSGRAAPSGSPTPGDSRANSRSGAALGDIGRADHDYLIRRELMVPVAGVGVSALRDDFTAGRSGGRSHNAIDIMAPRFTPVLAVDDGKVLSVRSNTLGGLIVYLLDEAERFVYYYAHLDSYREGLRQGEKVRAGDIIGYVGNTGNASGLPHHLHLQIMRYEPRRYWEGVPVNPFLLLQRPGTARPR
ncbi:MAG TPA: M23 family metallopeptidase [Gemmatimonadales bacterium]|nr:M23 family metallopeptidase [Gemmatimonadales bacterium]